MRSWYLKEGRYRGAVLTFGKCFGGGVEGEGRRERQGTQRLAAVAAAGEEARVTFVV